MNKHMIKFWNSLCTIIIRNYCLFYSKFWNQYMKTKRFFSINEKLNLKGLFNTAYVRRNT